jgi:hypothetical protein
MRTFNSLEDIAKEARLKDLEKQIRLEQLKLQVKSVGSQINNSFEPSDIAQLAGQYLGKFIHTKLKNY